MGSNKLNAELPGYRGEQTRDDAASGSSAVLLDDIDGYPEDELPAYTDLPESFSSIAKTVPVPRPNGGVVWYE